MLTDQNPPHRKKMMIWQICWARSNSSDCLYLRVGTVYLCMQFQATFARRLRASSAREVFSLFSPCTATDTPKHTPIILRLSSTRRYLGLRLVLPTQRDTFHLMPADRTNHTMSSATPLANGRGRGSRGRGGRGAGRGKPSNRGAAPVRNASTLIPAQVPYTVVKPEEPEAAPVLKKHLSDTKFQDFVAQGCS